MKDPSAAKGKTVELSAIFPLLIYISIQRLSTKHAGIVEKYLYSLEIIELVMQNLML